MKTKVLWIIGSNCSGKTTQSKLLHASLNKIPDINSDRSDKIIATHWFKNSKGEIDKFTLTQFKRSAHVGALRNNQCTGTDSLTNKEQIEASYLTTMTDNEPELVIIDGIMATSKWSSMIHQVPDIETYVILLDFENIEDNLKRLQQRRQAKNPSEVLEPLSEKTIKNITGKVKGFKSMYFKVLPDFNGGMIIDAMLPIETINSIILKKLCL